MTISDFDFISSKYLILKNSTFSVFCKVWQYFFLLDVFLFCIFEVSILVDFKSVFKILAFRAKRDFLSHLKDSA